MQNCHLGLDFLDELMDIITETESVHGAFRLWMTTEVHRQFPITLLQMSIKFANEPPQGLRAGLKRTYGGESRNASEPVGVFAHQFLKNNRSRISEQYYFWPDGEVITPSCVLHGEYVLTVLVSRGGFAPSVFLFSQYCST